MSKHEVGARTTFSAAHRLIGHKGACRNVHGHNWVVEAVFTARKIDKTGMVVDFHDVRSELNGLAKLLDHKMLNDVKELGSANPTAENLAAFFFKGLKKRLKTKISYVRVFETEDCWASYSE